MNQLDDKLQKAAEEVRQVARYSTPPGIQPGPIRLRTGWLVFAAAFAAVILAVGIIPLLGRGDNPGDVAGPSIAASTTLPATTTTMPPVECSATGAPQPAEQAGLPGAVAATRDAIVAAATACDLNALEELGGPDLNTSFGGGGFQNLIDWETSGQGELGTLVRLFDTPYAVQDLADQGIYYVWPAAFAYDAWEEIPADDLEALLAIYTQEELDGIALFGSYAGWRVGITDTGEWKFFIAGD
jgi:hypothetical protein